MIHRYLKIIILLFWVFGIPGCSPKADIQPPVKTPLSRSILGYGVVNVSYTRIYNEPGNDGVSFGYVREKTIVTVLERRLVKDGESQQFWVLIEGNYRGWLPESVIKFYDNEGKAQTAASQ
ncbi:MAG: hypothetical protein FWG07_07965 [Treponema sp.]|nr:hypothetical protein [Treponema sp.]